MASYAIIHNIPAEFRSQDLRHYFSDFINNSPSPPFVTFHYRHRREIKRQQNCDDEQKATCSKTCSKNESIATFCCPVKLTDDETRSRFVTGHSGRPWTDRHGRQHPVLKCLIAPVRPLPVDVEKLSVEFAPDASTYFPNGNVGTPDKFYADKIKRCTLPSRVIKKLNDGGCWLGGGPKRRRIYSNVPPPECLSRTWAKRDEIEEEILENERALDPEKDETRDLDDDTCQEFERHEANYDDVDEHQRTKERLFEEELEIVWEKGGPGLVFYTDSFFWDQQQGTDTDERWADDWDVDYRACYKESELEADKDARDMAQIRREEVGLNESVFKKKPSKLDRSKASKWIEKEGDPEFASFERHTRGFGGRLLKQSGWTGDRGVGCSPGAIQPVALSMAERAQLPYSTAGLGYKGEKLQRRIIGRNNRHIIPTVFDTKTNLEDDEKGDMVYRRNLPTYTKRR